MHTHIKHSHTTLTAQRDPFTDRFGVPLPRGLRDEAVGMSWASFCRTYEPNTGPLRLGQWTEIDAVCTGITAPRTYRATMALGERIETSTATACGPVAALTAMLADRGIGMETLNFHQLRDGDQTVTFVRGTDGVRTVWAMGRDCEATTSSLRAIAACVNRLATHSPPHREHARNARNTP